MFEVPHSKKTILRQLSKAKKINYNRFRWWRWYENKNTPLPSSACFRDKITNGDFDYSCYQWQAYLCELELNVLMEECYPDIQRYNEKSSLLRARRKKLLEDYERDEKDRLESLVGNFKKHFHITREEIEEEALQCTGEIIDLYYQIKMKYKEKWITSKRGRPKKVLV